MLRLQIIAMAMLLTVLAAIPAGAWGYQYVTQDQFREWLLTGRPTIIVDIQEPADFEKHHFRGSIRTEAFPVKSESERRKLDGAVKVAASSGKEVVIVCPRGGGGAKKTYDYLKEKGIDEKRLFILEKGMQGWPYPEISVRR
ncbi:rhodanese-like domain-containing protein [Geobacter sp. DSM 9736]|uniref:rhodanese-like domain-containing protein n=1 Tax=Geobacter sp. DSM 9736 TaxID=1277350 RepID=UPI000B514198|nr:rhodanese-like domain-containing protein [Geobacter sp. DSM 9736]SNB46055.1 Rhodanese-related sulfurtransferase [Geobacter sp. DSM 9736]